MPNPSVYPRDPRRFVVLYFMYLYYKSNRCFFFSFSKCEIILHNLKWHGSDALRSPAVTGLCPSHLFCGPRWPPGLGQRPSWPLSLSLHSLATYTATRLLSLANTPTRLTVMERVQHSTGTILKENVLATASLNSSHLFSSAEFLTDWVFPRLKLHCTDPSLSSCQPPAPMFPLMS